MAQLARPADGGDGDQQQRGAGEADGEEREGLDIRRAQAGHDIAGAPQEHENDRQGD